jgi:hypothetical protein
MMRARFSSAAFTKKMNNVVQYSEGFIKGIHNGKSMFLGGLGVQTIEILKQYIDANARTNPQALQHVYEWNRAGSPGARLFDIDYTISNLGLSFRSTFRQSTTVKEGSSRPFYDKARIMEEGIPVVIKPRAAEVLVFEENGETVFTKGPVYVANPGGPQAQGSFERAFDSFFRLYFSQSFLRSSGLLAYLDRPAAYKSNFARGSVAGRSVGLATGYRWIINAAGVR